jgi:hypothetical protein
MSLKNIIAILLLLTSVGLGIYKKYNTIEVDKDDVVILNIEKPDDSILNIVQPINNIIFDQSDKIKNAIFNQEFSVRVLKYNTDNQKINDLYVLAAKNFFKDTMNNKYDDLDVSLQHIFESVISSENHELTEEDKIKLSKTFSGLAWVLIQKK